MGYYCGLDLSARNCQVCVLDESGAVVFEKKLSNRLREILEAIKPFEDGFRCVVESGFNWYWLVDGLQEAGKDVTLAHAYGVRSITGAKVKTDRRDARTLASLLKGGMIPSAYICPKEVRSLRDLGRVRGRLVMQRASCYSRLRILLYQHGLLDHDRNSIKMVDYDQLAEWFEDPMVQLHAGQLLDRVALYHSQISLLEQAILERVKHRSAFAQLMTIPGIGPILAITIYHEVGDISRFANARHFSSYCRVVPGVAQSSKVIRRGRGSKQGNPYLKWALTEAAVFARRSNKKIARFYDRCLARHRGQGQRLVANNAVAHKLCQAVYHVLSGSVGYKEELLLGKQ